MRIGVFIDAPFRAEGGRVYSGDELLGFGRFAAAVGERLGGIRVIGRGAGPDTATAHALPDGVELAALPYYESLRDIGGVLRALPATIATMWRAIADLDLVWISTAAHPAGLALAALAALRRKRIALLVRQDTMSYFRNRLPSPRWKPILAAIWSLDQIYRLLSRRCLTTVVGSEIAASFGAPRPNLLAFEVNLIRSDQIAEPRDGAWGELVELLTVGRIEPEKNPLLAVAMMRELERAEPGRYRLTWVGAGRLAGAFERAAAEAGLAEQIRLPGFVAADRGLWDHYDRADAFVHISLTEGVPGVLAEAMARGLPVVATDVGGVRAAAADAALLVPPDDAEALASAILSLAGDAELRRRLTEAGAERARRTALDRESERVAAFLTRG